MKYEKALELADSLFEIQRLTRLLEPLIEDGKQEFDEFRGTLDSILARIFPTYTIAFAGPVNSGKSTLLSSLLREGGGHPISSIGPSNETFAPMTISYSKTASLLVRYFSIETLQKIDEYLRTLEAQGEAKHKIALYRDLRNTLQKIQAVTASEPDGGIVRKIDLSEKARSEILRIVRNHIAQSSGKKEVYGVYEVELAYPGKILRDLNNAKFVDLFGFGEPNPLINMKYTRFISEVELDIVVYVFPDRSVTEDFYQLFEINGFLEKIVSKGQLFLVLNKADAYTDITSPHRWNIVIDEFKKVLIKHVPVLKRYLGSIPIFVLSAASIDGRIAHKNEKAIREVSLQALYRLRDNLRHLSKRLERSSSDPSIYLSSIFDLLETLDLFAVGAEDTLAKIERRLPELGRLIDSISRNERTFDKRKSGILDSFRSSLQNELEAQLKQLDYKRIVRLVPSFFDSGNPNSLFRTMVDSAHKCVLKVYSEALRTIFEHLNTFTDRHLIAAYREYVSMQDDAIQKEFARLLFTSSPRRRPLSTTVEYGAKDLLHISEAISVQYSGKELLSRFAAWFLRERCIFDAERGQSFDEIHSQIVENVQKTIETFMLVFVCEEPRVSASYISHICPAGETTYWKSVHQHISKLDEILATQVQISKWRLGLYQNKVFFVSNKKEFNLYVKELLEKKDSTQKLILELL